MATTQSGDLQQLKATVQKSVQDHWLLFLSEGIALVLLGIIAIAVPVIASLAATILFGWIILISGGVGLVATIRARHAPGFWWALLSAIVGIVAGVILLGWPVQGTLTLTVVLVAFLVAEGVVSIMFALDHRKRLSGSWGWMLASGIVDLILAGALFNGLPGTALWGLGLLVGINMLFGGSSLIAMALHARGQLARAGSQ